MCFCGFFASAILADVISVINKRRRKEADERAEEVVKEINRRFSSRGAKWEYIGDKKMSLAFIEVTLSNRCAASTTTSYSSISTFSDSFSAYYSSPSYVQTPSAPPAPSLPESRITIPLNGIPPEESYPGDPTNSYLY